MLVSFAADSSEISIQKFLPDGTNSIMARDNFPLSKGVDYVFEINAIGPVITLAIDGAVKLHVTESFSTGQKMAIANREQPGCQTVVGPITVAKMSDARGVGGGTLVLTNGTKLSALRSGASTATVK